MLDAALGDPKADGINGKAEDLGRCRYVEKGFRWYVDSHKGRYRWRELRSNYWDQIFSPPRAGDMIGK